MADIVNRVQPIDLNTSKAYGSPDSCTFNLSDSGPIQPLYNVETSIELAVTNISFPNVLTAVQDFNSSFFITGGGQTIRASLPIRNFTNIKDLAGTLSALLVQNTASNFKVTADSTTNTLTITAPSSLQGTYLLSFQDKPSFLKLRASACKLMGFRKTDVLTFTGGTVCTSTVPCAISGPMNIYICTDIYSPEAATIDLFDSSTRGSILAKLTLTDAPWSISSYQDQLKAFTLKLPACNLNSFTLFTLNEELEPCGLPLDYSMTMTCTYFKPSPLVEINQKLDEVLEKLTYIFIQLKHQGDDERKRAKLQAKAAQDLEEFQGRRL